MTELVNNNNMEKDKDRSKEIKMIDYSDFPLIRMNLPDITNDTVYNEIVDGMEGFYDHKKNFQLEIETKNVKEIHMRYMYRFAKFLHKLRKKTPQYLQHTTINIYENLIYNLMYTLFTFLSKPIAPVKLIFWTSRENNSERKITKIQNFYP